MLHLTAVHAFFKFSLSLLNRTILLLPFLVTTEQNSELSLTTACLKMDVISYVATFMEIDLSTSKQF